MIHQYRNNGYNIVLDVNSGAVHVVDDLAYEVIAVMDRLQGSETPENAIKEALADRDADALAETIGEVRTLIEEEALFSPDPYEHALDRLADRPVVVKALCLHIAHDCNLACRYCFAEEGEYHGRRALMSPETGKAALDFLIRNSGRRRNLEVDFFGGEPTMNWETVKELVAYGREQEKLYDKHFRFTLTTNGVLLNDEIMSFCNREMDNVVLSFDGRREVNDRMRPFRGGQESSYDRIIPKFLKFAESRNQEKYYVRGTFTRYNLDFAADVLHMADLGFRQISVEPVVAPPAEDYAIRKEDLPYICEQYDLLAKEMVKRGFEEFLLLGVIGGRLDHTLANVSILLMLDTAGKQAKAIDDFSEMEIVSAADGRPGKATIEECYPYLSLLNITGEAEGITITNAKFPLEDGRIDCDYQYAVSNEVLPGLTAEVSVNKGRLLLIKDL